MAVTRAYGVAQECERSTNTSVSDTEGAAWLYAAAPFRLLAHDTQTDPVFVYGNSRAQAIFGYDWNEITALRSRLSAQSPEREARQAFLD